MTPFISDILARHTDLATLYLTELDLDDGILFPHSQGILTTNGVTSTYEI